METKVMVPKEHPEMPDFYGVTVYYKEGGSEKFKIATKYYSSEFNYLELRTAEDKFIVIPFNSIRKMEFDGKFTKIVQLKEEMAAEREKEKTQPKKKRASKKARR